MYSRRALLNNIYDKPVIVEKPCKNFGLDFRLQAGFHGFDVNFMRKV